MVQIKSGIIIEYIGNGRWQHVKDRAILGLNADSNKYFTPVTKMSQMLLLENALLLLLLLLLLEKQTTFCVPRSFCINLFTC